MSKQALAHGAMVLFTALVATSFTVGGLITREIEPEALTFLRFLIAAAIFLVPVAAQGKLALPGPRSWLRYGTIGFLLAVFFISMFVALRWTDPLSAGVVFALVPFMTALIARGLNGQHSSGRVWLGLLIGCAGATWVLFDGDWQKLLAFRIGRGEVIFLIGCAAYAAYSPAVRKLHRGETLGEINFFAIIAGALWTGVYGARNIATTDWLAIAPHVYAGITYLAVFTTAISFLLVKFASLNLPSAKVMAYTYLLPVFVTLYEGLIGHGWPDFPVLIGIAVTAAAVVVIETGR